MSIVAFKKGKEQTRVIYAQEEWRGLIAIEIRRRLQTGVKMHQIAADTGLCVATISNIFYGKTKFPRMATIASLMKYLGYQLFAQLK